MADYLWRLAVVLPLILMGAVAVLLILARRRGGALPGWLSGLGGAGKAAASPEALVIRVQTLTPAARVAVLRFAGRDHLVGFSGDAMLLIASSDAAPRSGEAGA